MKIKDRSTIPFHVAKGVLLTLLSIICVLPFIVIISGSLTDNYTILKEGFSLFPRNPTLEAYRTIFRSPEGIIQAYKMNFYYTVMGTADAIMSIPAVEAFLAQLDSLGATYRYDVEQGWTHEQTCIQSYTSARLNWVFAQRRE